MNFEILPQLLVNALITGSIYALASAGLALSYGLLRILNFAHGQILMLGAYMYLFWSIHFGLGLVLSSILTLLCGLIFALLMLHAFIAPFQKYSFLLGLVSTLALGIVLESVVALSFGVNIQSLNTDYSPQSFEIFSIYVTANQIVIIASALALLVGLAILVHLTPFGRLVRALSLNRNAAESLGINYQLTSTIVICIAVLSAFYAGVLIGFETNLSPTMGTPYTIKAFAAMVLGGLGSLWGAVVGSYLLGLIENLAIGLDFGSFSLPAGYKDAFSFAIILLVLLFRPTGLFGKVGRVA